MNENTYGHARCKQAGIGVAITDIATAVFAKMLKNILQAHTLSHAPTVSHGHTHTHVHS